MSNLIYDGLYFQNELLASWKLQNQLALYAGETQEMQFQFLDYQTNGFEWVTQTIQGQSPSLILRKILNSTSTQLLKFDSVSGTFIFNFPLNLSNTKITMLATPIISTDAATKGYVDSAIGGYTPPSQNIQLTGDVSGNGLTGSAIPTTLNKTLNQINNAGDLNIGSHKLTNVLDPTSLQDAATKNYVDTKTWTTSKITDFAASVVAFRLDQFASPTSPVAIGNQKLTSVSDPVNAQDGATKNYVDNKTWTSSRITDFAAAVTAFRLDQFAAPTSDVNLGNRKITSLASPSVSTDAVNKSYVDASVFNINTNTTGSLAINRLANYPASATSFLRGDGTWATPAGGGTVTGPVISTSDAIALYTDTTGTAIKNSPVTINDVSGVISGAGNPQAAQDVVIRNYIDKMIRTGKVHIGDIGGGTTGSLPSSEFSGCILSASKVNGLYNNGTTMLTITYADIGYTPVVLITVYNNMTSSNANDISVPVLAPYNSITISNTKANIFFEETQSVIQDITIYITLLKPDMNY